MSKVSFELRTFNPDLDLGVTKRYTLQQGLRYPDNLEPLKNSQETTYCNGPDGSYIGKALSTTIDMLHQQYKCSASASPDIHMENATSFERDTASLLQRYDPDRKPRSNRARPGIAQTTTHNLSWALSPSMWEALKTCMGITNEMFASPLDRSPHSEDY